MIYYLLFIKKKKTKIGNKKYRENEKLKQNETIAQCIKRLAIIKARNKSELSVSVLDQVE